MGVKSSLSLREQHGLRVIEDRVLWRLFGPTTDEIDNGK
jgi:hypothetical protein